MRTEKRFKALFVLGFVFLFLWTAGCSVAPSTPSTTSKAKELSYAMVDVQKILDVHPERGKLRQMEQAITALNAAEQDKSELLEIAKKEYETAMKVRQNQDQTALDAKQTELRNQINDERQKYIEKLDTEYRPLLFNLDLKMKSIQQTPTEAQALQREKERLENEKQQKLKQKEDELVERFQKEMDSYAKELANQSEIYAKKWMDDRMRDIYKPVASQERERLGQEITNLSKKMMQDVRSAVAKVAEKEKIDIVLLKPAVRKPVKDISDLVSLEIVKGK